MEVAKVLCYYGSIVASMASMFLRLLAIYSGSRVTKGIGIALLVVAFMAVTAYSVLVELTG